MTFLIIKGVRRLNFIYVNHGLLNKEKLRTVVGTHLPFVNVKYTRFCGEINYFVNHNES